MAQRNWLVGAALAFALAAPFPCLADTITAATVTGSETAIAAAFGARDRVASPSLSPDGRRLVYIEPGVGQKSVASVVDLATGEHKVVAYADGAPLRLSSCGWSANDRLVCTLYAISRVEKRRLSWTRLLGVDADGTHIVPLGLESVSPFGSWLHQYDGHVLDWMAGDGQVLMIRGRGVELVDTRTGKGEPVRPAVGDGWTDGAGNVRIIGQQIESGLPSQSGTTYRYRLAGQAGWKPFGRVDLNGSGLRPVAVDGTRDLAYALQKKNGRDALYSVALDGSMKTNLVYANPNVDVDGVETIGRRDRVIGLHYETDQPQRVYFDEGYRRLAASLSRALPHLAQIRFVSASADEQRLLLFAGSDVDPGHYYLFDRTTHKLTEVLQPRPDLATIRLSEQHAITYPASDGTPIPAYLTLPPGIAIASTTARGLPALVMPHGGPAARDHWGFDWLAQYFAQRGFAVLQPQYRGSTGYGDTFFVKNGFQSWRTAIGDVRDAGRWLVAQGIAAPSHLAVFGWSYGGYAALQASVLDPTLFHAIVAVAPVTDLARLKSEAVGFSNEHDVARFVGQNTHEGSPVRHADAIVAPVLIFHGDQDINVDVGESRAMDAALHRAGKSSRLIVYPGLDHQLDDAQARTDLLTQADAFLQGSLAIDR